MRIRLDENISYRVANSIKAFLSNRSGGLTVDWVGDDNPPRTSDPTWIKRYAEAGGLRSFAAMVIFDKIRWI